ncbi:hypothetical protein COO91_09452 (plasmid) [Nostoc flagelliforme CCNUN1]|uniref:Uncharacterized protein n=1 Tax=Nostoc flagelliforme CCNUN1 TaxID=2038116 RepID=A0A2K8T6J8_9NOSO|nr:hypothetical protein [Nostoc flagelliforme]AUB43279.1 hypothetical protein COO91_09452 [Nostoc flagelliforme CCNUN1]
MSDNTFTRAELFELLSANYSPQEIIAGLKQLATSDSTVDPNAEEFPVEISDRLERLFNLAQATLDKSKLLGGSSNLANIQTHAIDMATEQLQLVGVSRETFKAFLDIVAGKTVAQALAVHEFEQELFDEITSELDARSLQRRTEQGFDEIAFIYQLAKNPEIRQQITQEYGLKTGDEIKQQVQTLTTAATVGFDPKAFLDELGVPTSEKKSTRPATIQDLKNLTRSLLSEKFQSPA